jgi:hypothetical protein
VPAASDAVVIPKGGGAIGLMVSDSAAVATPPPLSASLTVKAAVPGAEGVPPMTPVGAARLKPCGKVPSDIVQVTGETAPDTARAAEYGEPAVPFGNTVVVITGLELMAICRGCVSVAPAASRTLAVNVDVPFFCGVPLMTPSLPIASPAGSDAAGISDQV